MKEVIFIFPVVNDIRRPEAAKVLIANLHKPLFGPVCQVVRFPYRKTFASVSADFLPGAVVLVSHTVGKAEIRCKYIESAVLLTPGNCEIPDSLVSVIGPEDRISSIDLLPVKAVPAQSEIYLFSVRGGFFFKMYE